MNITYFFTQVAIFAFGGIITVAAAYFLLKNDIQNYFRFKTLEANKDSRSSLFPLRLQAYERLIIFTERINPANLLVRLHQQGIGVKELQAIILNDIKSEYQHNITQQLYVDSISWNVVRKLKDDTIAMVNNVVQGLPETATGIDISKKVLQHMSGIEENPYDLTIDHLKKDIHKLF
ncbi:hypothetical protein EZ428_07140 [Pedobacter frigiditerrae]|uniref:Uncharacterized protein n=1 Tax=Pedobacter frigiditerrae TaxID=2530452 RepID=A0A4R0N3S6_9SPHI|nr:hypothetical protein [Pedobacter frigiditerrae]TCC94538.1 hypothetical protein EZ428_07140 [Pedobacter frigiditerrae]